MPLAEPLASAQKMTSFAGALVLRQPELELALAALVRV
jgi:hypothetical protein